MAITGIDTIEGKQIIAAGAVSAKSAERAFNDENGNPITGYLTAVPEGYVTTEDLTAYQPTADMTAYATVESLTSKQDAGDYISASDSANFLLTSDSGNFYPMTGNPSGFINELPQEEEVEFEEIDLADYQPVSSMTAYQSVGDYYSASNPSGFITGVDLTPYQTTADMTAYLTTGDSANFATTGDVEDIYERLSDCITALPDDLVYTADIQDMATTGDLTGKQDISGMTAYQPVGNYQTAGDYLTTADSANFYTTANESGFITGVDLTPYQLTADMTAYQPAGDYLTTGDSAEFYTTANESGFISEVPATYLQNTDLEISDNKITGISGVPLAGGGGGEVPEGTIVASGLEFNAVNEISGYSGSAIAQYGAEKQWLVHDDTLVHASNSAQYALGVNISAIAQLLGVDETVLYNNTATTTADVAIGSTFNISEPITNFNKFKIYYSRFPVTSVGATNGGPCSQIREYDSTSCSAYFVINETFPTSTAQEPDWFDISMLIETISGTTWKCKACYQSQLPNGTLDKGWTYLKPYKIIGIGRKI